MRHKLSFYVTSLAFGLACNLAHAQLVKLTWDASGHFAHRTNLAPGKFVEVCEKLPEGAKVTWSYRSDAPLNFNIHYHEGKEVKFPAKRDDSSDAEGRLDVSLTHDYCWMWTNKRKDATILDLMLTRE